MQKTKIPWATHTSNPVKGLCPMACKDNQGKEYCYARALYKRFGWSPKIRFEPEEFAEWDKAPVGSRIFVGSTIELFGEWVPDTWMKEILRSVKRNWWITFQFLTKQPQNLLKFSPFPGNCWVGVSATNMLQYQTARNILPDIEAPVRFISFEPLLEQCFAGRPGYAARRSDHTTPLSDYFCNWIILGGKTGPARFYPPESWIQDIESAADMAGVPVFEKQNLRKQWEKPPRQEMPGQEKARHILQGGKDVSLEV